MVDPKRLIKSMELCIGAERDCHKCMYCETENDCRDSMIYDAVELLKEQEPIPCGEKIKAGDIMLDFYECGYCKNAIRKPWKYCPFCGKAVKWDD